MLYFCGAIFIHCYCILCRGPAKFVTELPAYHDFYDESPQPEDVKTQFTKQIQQVVAKHPTRTTKNRWVHVESGNNRD